MTAAYSTVASYGNPVINPDGSTQVKSEYTASGVAFSDPLTGTQANTAADLLLLILIEMRAQTVLLQEGLNTNPNNDPQLVRIDPTTNPVTTGVPPVFS